MFEGIISKIKEEIVFLIVLMVTAVTCIFRIPDIEAIDWKVIAALFNLMLISLALEKYKLLDKIAMKALGRFNSNRTIAAAMMVTTALIAMLITNDVALLTVVPLTIIMARKASFDPFKIIVLETAAANIGSSLTPFGNPQNLYLYAFYKIPTLQFFSITSVFVVVGMALLFAYNLMGKSKKLHFDEEVIIVSDKKRVMIYLGLLIIVLLSILRIVDFKIATMVTALLFIILDRDLFKKVDFVLLGTFVFFFLFVDNITHMEFIKSAAAEVLTSPLRVLTASAILSQVISNVPAAILLSGFSGHYEALLLGVSIGGMGTMVASLANLISYKLYCKEYNGNVYNKLFYRVNFTLLALLFLVGLLLLIF